MCHNVDPTDTTFITFMDIETQVIDNVGVGKTYNEFPFHPFQLWRARKTDSLDMSLIQFSRATQALHILGMKYKPNTKATRRTDDRRLAEKDIDGGDLRDIRTY